MRSCAGSCNLTSWVAEAPAAELSLQCKGLRRLELQAFMPWILYADDGDADVTAVS